MAPPVRSDLETRPIVGPTWQGAAGAALKAAIAVLRALPSVNGFATTRRRDQLALVAPYDLDVIEILADYVEEDGFLATAKALRREKRALERLRSFLELGGEPQHYEPSAFVLERLQTALDRAEIAIFARGRPVQWFVDRQQVFAKTNRGRGFFAYPMFHDADLPTLPRDETTGHRVVAIEVFFYPRPPAGSPNGAWDRSTPYVERYQIVRLPAAWGDITTSQGIRVGAGMAGWLRASKQ